MLQRAIVNLLTASQQLALLMMMAVTYTDLIAVMFVKSWNQRLFIRYIEIVHGIHQIYGPP